jgi:hypothetical protein
LRKIEQSDFSEGYSKEFVNITDSLYDYVMSPEDVIFDWLDFVTDLEDGYFFIPPELDNDLDVIRLNIDNLLSSEELEKYPDHHFFCKVIEEIDIEFKRLTFELKFPHESVWWKRRVLKKAGRDYAEFANAHWGQKYGIEVIVVDEYK